MIQDVIELDPLMVCNQNRKLKAVWSMEAQQDIRAMHNIDAAAALTKQLADEINAEIDREVINDLAHVFSHGVPPPPSYVPPPQEPAWGYSKKKVKRQYRSIDAPWEA